MVRSYSLTDLNVKNGTVNTGKDDQMEISGYRYDRGKTIVTWVFIVVTVGFLRLVFHWKPDWMLRCTHTICELSHAEKVLLKDEHQQYFVEKVRLVTKDGKSVQLLNNPDVSYAHAQARVQEDLSNIALQQMDDGLMKYFMNRKIKYIWDRSGSFIKQKGLEENLSCSYFHEAQGLDITEQARQRVLYGLNTIEVHVTPILRLLFAEILNPFYIFQVFSVILWYNDEYYYYATAIIIISIISITASVIQTRMMERALKNTISGTSIENVCRGNNEYEEIPSDLLVPGDLIEIPRHGCIMQCDAVLITGKCIVDESMLTGESIPVTKTPIPHTPVADNHKDTMFSLKEHSRHVLFCGTKVIQTRYYSQEKVKAVVIRTGFATTKGELVRSIMFPKPVDFKFTKDIAKYLAVLAMIAGAGMIFTLVIMIRRGNTVRRIILRTLDLITIVIPPALPASMTFGVMFAQRRLKQQKIYCISPTSINVAGSINTICFDKTGTLTEEGLDLWGVLPISDRNYSFDAVQHDPSFLPRGPMLRAMATCHSLTILEGQLSGDPLDLKMFQSTEWNLEEPGDDTSRFDTFMPTIVRPKTSLYSKLTAGDNEGSGEVGILRQFPFSSSLQRMSVIARSLDAQEFDLYVKGSPEMIASLSKPETVPADFHEVLMTYTEQGYRVLALAWRPLKSYSIVKVQRINRQEVECDLNFLGLLVMENRIKAETSPVIRQLKEANLRPIMVTGDNMLTALSVARDCGIVEPCDHVLVAHALPPIGNQPASLEWIYADEGKTPKPEKGSLKEREMIKLPVEQESKSVKIALTGKSWAVIREHFPDIIPKVGICGSVLARMAPEQKSQFVEALQNMGYYVAMCGDGANDCGALKVAHTGISLSEAEASVASPFTAKEQNIACVPTVIREGRCALVTSFCIIKYMVTYSLTQFCCVTIQYVIDANMTDLQFLYVDLFLLTIFSIAYGYTAAHKKLSPDPPPISLVSLTPILSMLTQLVFIVAFQLFTWYYVQQQPWFTKYEPNEDEEYVSDENTALFNISIFQYVTLAIIFTKGAPYRKHLFTNYFLFISIIILTAVNVYLVMYPFPWLVEEFELQLPPSLPFRGLFIYMASINFFLAFFCERYVVDGSFVKRQCQDPLDDRYRRRHYDYVTAEENLRKSSDWPAVTSSVTNMAELMRSESVTFDSDTVSKKTDKHL